MAENLENQKSFMNSRVCGTACGAIDPYEQMVLAVCDLEGFAADAAGAGNDRTAEILYATANMLRAVVPFDFSTNKN